MNDNKQQADFAAALNKLKQAYIDRLPNELNNIHQTFNELAAGTSNPENIETLRQMFHKMAGASGTFGLRELGLKAKAIELTLKDWQKAGHDALSAKELENLKKALDELESASEDFDTAASTNFNLAPAGFAKDDLITLWLVEDDHLLASELKRQFNTFGFDSRIFNTFEDANEAAKHSEPDAIILDVMFDEGKVNATEAYAKSPHLCKLTCPIIFMSAFDDFASRIRAVQLNAKGYFLKPISVPAVVNYLRRIFETANIPNSHILLVEDDEELARHYQLILQAAGFNARCLFEPEKIIDTLEEFNPEVVLMDLNMPQYSGMELAGVIRQHEHWLSLPILYLSAETDLETQADALEKGAEDFLTKPISDIQLISTVRARVIRSRQLEEKISRDSMTGLLKHAVIKESVRHEVERTKRTSQVCCIVMLDIDHFKKVNDTYGHASGDIVITSIATVLQQRLRKTDIIGRYGGEEFAVVLPECDEKKAFSIFEEIRHSFNELEFQYEQQKFNCSFSAGIICTEDFPDIDGEQMLVSADNCLYHAKKNGRNQVALASNVLTSEEYLSP